MVDKLLDCQICLSYKQLEAFYKLAVKDCEKEYNEEFVLNMIEKIKKEESN